MIRFALLAFFFSSVVAGTVAAAEPIRNPADFMIRRGVNVSHWLSQCPKGFDRAAYMTEQDFEFIRRIGYDHVRISVDEIELWSADDQRIASAFEALTRGLNWARKHDLRAIVDLHTVRSHHFNSESGANTLWTDPAALQKFLRVWADLSDGLKSYPVAWVAYEIMNEPVADDPEDWNKVVAAATAALRLREPQRVLVIGSNRWQKAATFPALKIPAGDANIILSVHDYEPFAFTHHMAPWTQIRDYRGSVRYPGPTVAANDFAAIKDEALKKAMHRGTESWDRARMVELLRPAIEKARELRLQLYCGEFGCLPTVPRRDRLAWYADLVDVLESNGIAWANWEYKAEFGILQYDFSAGKPTPPDQELIDILLRPRVRADR